MPTRRKEFCKRGHRIADDPYIFPDGKRTCRKCRQVWKKQQNLKIKARNEAKRAARRAAAMPTLPVPYGLTKRQVSALITWAVRRAKYGASGVDPSKIDSVKARGRILIKNALANPPKLATHCRNGHPRSADNTRTAPYFDHDAGKWKKRRACRLCERARKRQRPEWIDYHGTRISLRAHDRYFKSQARAHRRAVIDSHPDKGGTSRQFSKARRAQEAFLAEQAAWYSAHGYPMPPMRTVARMR